MAAQRRDGAVRACLWVRVLFPAADADRSWYSSWCLFRPIRGRSTNHAIFGAQVLAAAGTTPFGDAGLLAFVVGLAILALSETSIAAAVAGCLAALGYGVIHPTCVEWASHCYPPAARARPVALINMSFHIGSIVSAQLTGWTLAVLGWHGVLTTLATIIVLVMAVIAALEKRQGSWRDRGSEFFLRCSTAPPGRIIIDPQRRFPAGATPNAPV